MPLGREAGNYKPKVNENDLSAQMLLSKVKRMIYLLVMKNKQEIKVGWRRPDKTSLVKS